MDDEQNVKIAGRVTSPGMVIGPAFVYHDRPDELSPPRTIKRHQIKEELSDIERAVKIVRGDLKIFGVIQSDSPVISCLACSQSFLDSSIAERPLRKANSMARAMTLPPVTESRPAEFSVAAS